MLERLHKVLARAGVAALRPAEDMIMDGRVTVNGRVVRELGARVDPDTDVIAVDGQLVEMPVPSDPRRYLALHKPVGVVSTAFDPQGRPTVVGLVPNDARLFPVGRLDTDSEGLLLLTNDGDLTYRLTHPRFEVEKEYRVLLDHTPRTEDLRRWREGVELEGQMTMPAWIEVLDRTPDGTWVRVVMREGRNRQIREVARLLGYQVLRLIRVREGPLVLGDLAPGAWRELTPAEVQSLRAHTQHIPSRAADQERERRMADSDRPGGRRLRIIRGQRREPGDSAQTPHSLDSLVEQARSMDQPEGALASTQPPTRRARVYQDPATAAARPPASRPASEQRPPRAAGPRSAPAEERRPAGRQQGGYGQRDQRRAPNSFDEQERRQPRYSDSRSDESGRRNRDVGGRPDQRGPQRGYNDRGPQRSFDNRGGPRQGSPSRGPDDRSDRGGPGRSYGQGGGAPYGNRRPDERGGPSYDNRRPDQRSAPRNYDRRPGPPRPMEPSDDRHGRAFDNEREPGNQRNNDERGQRPGNSQRPYNRSPRDYADRGNDAPRDRGPRDYSDRGSSPPRDRGPRDYSDRGPRDYSDRGPRPGFGDRRPRTGAPGGPARGGARPGFGGRPPQRNFEQGAERRDRPARPGGPPRSQGGIRSGLGQGRSYDRQSEGFNREGGRSNERGGVRRPSGTGGGGFNRGPSSGPSRGPSSGFNRGPSGGPSRGPSRGPSGGFNRGPSGGPSRGPSSGFNRGPSGGTGRPPSRGPGRPTNGANRDRPSGTRPNNNAGPRRAGPPRRRDDEE